MLKAVSPSNFSAAPKLNGQVLATGAEAGGVAWPWTVFRASGRTVIQWGRHAWPLARARRAEGATLQVCDPAGLSPEQRLSVVFFAVSELLRRHGLFTVHAAAVERDGAALLIVGQPGAGKTTAMLSLLRAGWRLLSDDHPLLRDAGKANVELLPFAVPARVTRDTVSRFPELARVIPRPPVRAKATVPIETVAYARYWSPRTSVRGAVA